MFDDSVLAFRVGSGGIVCFEAIRGQTILNSSLFAAPLFAFVGYRQVLVKKNAALARQVLELLAVGIVIDCILAVISDRRYMAAALVSHLFILALVLATRLQIKCPKP
jgi:hypothetical protein